MFALSNDTHSAFPFHRQPTHPKSNFQEQDPESKIKRHAFEAVEINAEKGHSVIKGHEDSSDRRVKFFSETRTRRTQVKLLEAECKYGVRGGVSHSWRLYIYNGVVVRKI